jgi:hypothetical protein
MGASQVVPDLRGGLVAVQEAQALDAKATAATPREMAEELQELLTAGHSERFFQEFSPCQALGPGGGARCAEESGN